MFRPGAPVIFCACAMLRFPTLVSAPDIPNIPDPKTAGVVHILVRFSKGIEMQILDGNGKTHI